MDPISGNNFFFVGEFKLAIFIGFREFIKMRVICMDIFVSIRCRFDLIQNLFFRATSFRYATVLAVKISAETHWYH